MSDRGDRLSGGVAVPGYEIERELGRGGFAVVYRSHQPKLRRTVALKVLTNVDPTDDDAKRRFEAECQAIGSLSWHPHVVTVYDAGATEDGLPFLAMEHLPSGSLQAKLGDHGPAPLEEVLRIAVQMCDALGAAHKAGILHRDIKPANVLTSRIGDYKLADFGIARFGDSQRTATGVITGTVAYTAPEVLRGERASASSDLYALGAMLSAVASGRTPFVKDVDESVVAIMYRVNTEDPPPLTDVGVPEDVAKMIHTLMDKDPAKRPASALEAAQWAQHLQEQRGITSVPLHTDPDLLPGLPPAAVAAGAGAAAATGAPTAPAPGTTAPGTPAPPPATGAPATPYGQAVAPPTTGTPAPQGAGTPAPYGGTPAPYGGTPAPPGYATAGGASPPSYGGPPTATPSGTYPTGAPSGAYPTGYGYGTAPPPSSPSGSGGGKVVAIVAAIAVVAVILIIVLFAFVSSAGDSSSTGATTTTEATTEAPGPTDATTTTSEETTTTTEATTTTAAVGAAYPASARTQFVDSCTGSGGSTESCTCALEQIEQRYSFEEFSAIDEDVRNGGTLPSDIQDIITGCA